MLATSLVLVAALLHATWNTLIKFSGERLLVIASMDTVALAHRCEQSELRNELLIFITPRIVNRAEALGALSAGAIQAESASSPSSAPASAPAAP